VLDETLIIRRLQFFDVVRESLLDTATDSAEAVFDAEFALMSAELAVWLPRLLELFGGEVEGRQSEIKINPK
jgi:recombination associated protein RdgC